MESRAIEVKGLTKSFGVHSVLRGLDFRVEVGEAAVIFGPNGAGKTTLIKILATIMNPSSGDISFGGLSLKDNAEEIRRQVGVVTHQPFLYGDLSVNENLTFFSRMYDVPQAKERIREVVALVGMSRRLHDRVRELSHGMKQRIAIARAILHRPSIMLLDEPETGLDQQAVASFWQTMRCDGEIKRTVVLTTHNLERGLELGDHLVILAKGKIAYQESASALDLGSLKEAYQDCTKVKV